MSADDEFDDKDLARLDENVKHIRKSVDKLLEKQGTLENRVQSNESDIENLDQDVQDLDKDVGRVNRNVIIGLLLTITTVLLTAFFTGGIPG